MKKAIFALFLLFSFPAHADQHEYVQYDCATGEISGTVISPSAPDVSGVSGRCQIEVTPGTSTDGKMVDLNTLQLVDAPPQQ